jgi:hypothetical protein
MRWVQLLKRMFAIDIEQCPHFGGQLMLFAAIEEPAGIARILGHLGLDAQPPPRAPARRVDLLLEARSMNPDWVGTGPMVELDRSRWPDEGHAGVRAGARIATKSGLLRLRWAGKLLARLRKRLGVNE